MICYQRSHHWAGTVSSDTPPEGFRGNTRFLLKRDVDSAVAFFVLRLLRSRAPKLPQVKHKERNRMIRALFGQGMTPKAIAARFGITDKRVYQIVHESDD